MGQFVIQDSQPLHTDSFYHDHVDNIKIDKVNNRKNYNIQEKNSDPFHLNNRVDSNGDSSGDGRAVLKESKTIL